MNKIVEYAEKQTMAGVKRVGEKQMVTKYFITKENAERKRHC